MKDSLWKGKGMLVDIHNNPFSQDYQEVCVCLLG